VHEADPPAQACRLLGQQPDAQPGTLGPGGLPLGGTAVVGHRHLDAAVDLTEADDDGAGVGVLLGVEQTLADSASSDSRNASDAADTSDSSRPNRVRSSGLSGSVVRRSRTWAPIENSIAPTESCSDACMRCRSAATAVVRPASARSASRSARAASPAIACTAPTESSPNSPGPRSAA
jgi:hypothetical protein